MGDGGTCAIVSAAIGFLGLLFVPVILFAGEIFGRKIFEEEVFGGDRDLSVDHDVTRDPGEPGEGSGGPAFSSASGSWRPS